MKTVLNDVFARQKLGGGQRALIKFIQISVRRGNFISIWPEQNLLMYDKVRWWTMVAFANMA